MIPRMKGLIVRMPSCQARLQGMLAAQGLAMDCISCWSRWTLPGTGGLSYPVRQAELQGRNDFGPD